MNPNDLLKEKVYTVIFECGCGKDYYYKVVADNEMNARVLAVRKINNNLLKVKSVEEDILSANAPI